MFWRIQLVFWLVTVLVVEGWAGRNCTLRAQPPSGLELLGQGVNYGNMLEAPSEGAWGVRFDDAYPRLVKQAGFDSVRIPVKWSAHAAEEAPYRIDPEFLARVQHVVERNLQTGLKVVLNMHHYDEIYREPAAHRERFLRLWEQIAEAFAEADENVFFELLNEPAFELKGEEWNQLAADALSIVRQQHPQRWVVIGPDRWNNVKQLPTLRLPKEDRRIVVTVHYYIPHEFTHQGAEWSDPVPPVGVPWPVNAEAVERMEMDFAEVANWAQEHDRPIYVGEFGAYNKADMDARVRWTQAVRENSEKQQFAWAYWELAAGFGVLDPRTNRWREPLLDALLE